MAALGSILLVIGGLILLVGGIMLLVVAFQESVLWGLGSMFIPFVGLVFLILHWEDAKNSFFVSLAGVPFYIVGFIIVTANAPK